MSTTYPSWLLSSERVQEVVPIQGHPNICEYRTYHTLTGIASYYLAWTVVCVFHLHMLHIARDTSSCVASWEQVICDKGHTNMIYSEKNWLKARRDVLRTFRAISFAGPRIFHQPRIIPATSDVRLHWVNRDSPRHAVRIRALRPGPEMVRIAFFLLWDAISWLVVRDSAVPLKFGHRMDQAPRAYSR
jgi:hypothetical protein